MDQAAGANRAARRTPPPALSEETQAYRLTGKRVDEKQKKSTRGKKFLPLRNHTVGASLL